MVGASIIFDLMRVAVLLSIGVGGASVVQFLLKLASQQP